jgi:type I restriction enzyme S subunit
MTWEKVKLGDITDSCLGKMLDKNKNKGDLQPYLANVNVRWGDFDLDDLSLMRFEEKEQERYGLKYGDLIVCEGGEIGRCAIWKDQVSNMKIQKALHRIRPKDNRLNNFYLYYWFLNEGKRGGLEQYCSGQTTIKHLPAVMLKSIEISLPPREVQDKIAGILSKYDELIENSRKQIALLEEAAQRLYREWFVDFRFPGHKKNNINEKGLPTGWINSTIGELSCSIESGSRPKGGVGSLSSGIPSIGAENIIGLGRYNYASEKYITKEFYENLKKGVLKNRDILIYKDGAYIGRTTLFQDGFPHDKCAVNEHVFLLHTSRELLQYYLFFTLYQETYFHKMQALNANAAQPGLNRNSLNSLSLIIPSDIVLEQFHTQVSPIMVAIHSKAKQIKLLSDARDALLPKLMSGELKV